MSPFAELEAELRSAFGPSVRVAAELLGDRVPELLPEETPMVAKAVFKRRREVAVSRDLARRELARFGAPPGPLLRNEDRSPRWPGGYLGSITHTVDVCIVVVAKTSEVRWLAVDIEAQRVSENLFRRILLPAERAIVDASDDPTRTATTYFSAKEAFYKAQYRETETYLGFQDVEVTFGEGGQFSAAIVNPKLDVPALALRGFHRSIGDWVVTGIHD